MSDSGGNKPNKGPDWKTLEAEYRAGVRSIRELGRRYHVAESVIRKRARKLGWTRDPAGRWQAIHARLDAQRETQCDPATVAERLAEEAQQDASDLGSALATARVILRRLREAAEAEPSPQGLRTIAEAVSRAVEVIFRVRRLDDQPANQEIVIERSYRLSPTDSPSPSDDF